MNKKIDVPGITHYYGGKSGSGTYQTIINHIPPHKVYIEPFLGGGAIIRHKLTVDINIGIDKDAELIEKYNQAAFKGNFRFFNTCGIGYLETLLMRIELSDWDPATIFIYADPPYRLSSRKHQKLYYNYEMTENQHWSFLNIAVNLPFKTAISHCPDPIYDQVLKDWRKVQFQSTTRQGTTTENLYMNYRHPEELQDYRYIGHNFRERERIKKKVKRHVERLKRLPVLERNAILKAINKNYQ